MLLEVLEMPLHVLEEFSWLDDASTRIRSIEDVSTCVRDYSTYVEVVGWPNDVFIGVEGAWLGCCCCYRC